MPLARSMSHRHLFRLRIFQQTASTNRGVERAQLLVRVVSYDRHISQKKRKWGELCFDIYESDPAEARKLYLEYKKEVDAMVEKRDLMKLKAEALARGKRPEIPKKTTDDGATDSNNTMPPARKISLSDDIPIATPVEVTDGDSI